MVDHDIWFLNVQARTYCEQCDEIRSPLYRENVECIKELFGLVPEELKGKLDWAGPQ